MFLLYIVLTFTSPCWFHLPPSILTPQRWICYPIYCVGALFPCCIGHTREYVAEKYNLSVSQWEPTDCGWMLVKCIGMRLTCFASVCVFPFFHIAQMRAEIAFRKHGKATVCPCCCCFCGEGNGPPASSMDIKDADYPRAGTVDPGLVAVDIKKTPLKEVALDYPRVGTVDPGLVVVEKKPKPAEKVVLDYPRAGTVDPSLVVIKAMPKPVEEIVLDYPRYY